MGKNKLAKFAEMETFPHVLQYPFARLQQEAFPLRGRWREDFFHNDRPIVLELGCGKGEYTVGLGELYPRRTLSVWTSRALASGRVRRLRTRRV